RPDPLLHGPGLGDGRAGHPPGPARRGGPGGSLRRRAADQARLPLRLLVVLGVRRFRRPAGGSPPRGLPGRVPAPLPGAPPGGPRPGTAAASRPPRPRVPVPALRRGVRAPDAGRAGRGRTTLPRGGEDLAASVVSRAATRFPWPRGGAPPSAGQPPRRA